VGRAIVVVSLTIAVVAVAIAAFVDRGSFHRSSTVLKSDTVRQAVPDGAGVNGSTGTVPSDEDDTEAVADVPSEGRHSDANTARGRWLSDTRVLSDESTVSDETREGAREDTERSYLLMFEHLGLSAEERQALLALLVEIRIAGTWASDTRGRIISESERAERIARVIGRAKLQEFLALERNLSKYWETSSIGALLKGRGVALSDIQRDRLFKILVDAEDLYRAAPPDLDRNSIEYLEYLIADRDEYERHVLELAPSALSSRQVIYLFEQYQRMSNRRIASLAQQKQRRSDNPTEKLPLVFPPWID
jgi:hypothetical protein